MSSARYEPPYLTGPGLLYSPGDVPNLEFAVEYATNLSSWTVVEIGATSSVAGDVTVTVVENGDEPDDITVRIPIAGNPRMFVRMNALLD